MLVAAVMPCCIRTVGTGLDEPKSRSRNTPSAQCRHFPAMTDEAEGGQSHIEHASMPAHSSVNASSMVALKAELARAQNSYSKVCCRELLHALA